MSSGLRCCPNGCYMPAIVPPPPQVKLLVAVALSWLAGRCSQPSEAAATFPVLLHLPLGGREWMEQAELSAAGLYS